MRKYFLLGFLPVFAIALVIYFSQMISDSKAGDEVLENLTIFEDIDELSFLAPYEVEKSEPELPNHALKGYCAKISYEGKEYSVTALAFESEDWARLYLNDGVPLPQGIADYHMLLNTTNNKGSVEAAGGGNYYKIEGNSRGEFLEFVKFMSSNMSVPVYQGD